MTIFTNISNNTKPGEKPEVFHPKEPSIRFKNIIQFILSLAIMFDALILVQIWGGSEKCDGISNYFPIMFDIAYFIGITLNSPHIMAIHFAHTLYNFFWYAIFIAYPVYLKELSTFFLLALFGAVYVAYLYMVFNLANYERRRRVIKKKNVSATTENEKLGEISIRY